MTGPVAVVTGGSSGVGKAAAAALAARGCTVYELSRSGADASGVRHVTADVTDPAQVGAAVSSVLAREGRIDVLICCAGFGISGALEYTDPADARRLLDVNLFGVTHAVQAVLPHMRERGAGRIVVISSVGAIAALPFQGWYSVSKAAVGTYAQALRNEVRPYGVTVCAVLPGDIRTGFTDAREKSHAGDDVYGGRIGRSVSKMEHDERTGMAPETAGRAVARIALRRRVKPQYSIGFVYKLLCVLIKLLPASLASRVLYSMYAK